MPREEDSDLYDEEFDFVDDDDASNLDDESDVVDEAASDDIETNEGGEEDEDEPVDEYGRPEPAPNYVVHVYEYNKFKRTLDRPFTPEDAEAFATEFNRTGKSYGRVAVTSKNDAKPKKTLE